MKKVKIALVQMSMSGIIEENLEKTLKMMKMAAGEGADLILFPESQFSPYFPQFPDRDASHYLVTLNHYLIRRMQKVCRRKGVLATANVYLAEPDGNYSATVMIGRKGEILGVSKKMHIPYEPLFYEQRYFAASHDGFRVYDTDIGNIGVVICYDRHYPESVRACVLQGAELILIPTANTLEENIEMYEREVQVLAYQNTVYTAMCNRVGAEHQMVFAGESLIIDPNGMVVAKGNDTEQILRAELDLRLIQRSRQQRPYLSLRNPRLSTFL